MSRESTAQLFYDLGANAEAYIQFRNSKILDESQKDVRTFSKAEAAEHLGINVKTLDKYVDKAGIDPRRHIDAAWILTIEELYCVRNMIPEDKRKAPKFKRALHQKTQRIVIQNQKGGVGKTIASVTVAACLATEFHEEFRIGLVDMDPQSTASIYYAPEAGKQNCFSVGDLLTNNYELDEGETLKDVVSSSFLKTTIPNLRVLPATQSDRSIEGWFHKASHDGTLESPYTRLNEVLSLVDDEFDIILIDTPPSLGFGTINSYFAGTSVIFPVSVTENDIDATCSYFSFIPQVWELIAGAGHPGYDFMKVLLTNYKSSNGTAELQSRFNEFFSHHIYSKEFKHSESIKVCSSVLCTVFDISKSSYPKSKLSFAGAVTNAKEVTLQVLSDVKMVWGR
ncbi:chromosome partitioning protein ParA [Pseudoalteromonas sp. BMB]|uniref:ParA family protein n=1 Tax=Pseudoalteromonas sp. BMB TaxID=1874619 RepID=UPI00083E6452|nr:ParA family protein [Pseudoalteromonas sp. BMB]ODB35879.1 chromosome partitioning protein ParA [Pseudoalteromonas sp. BMB]